MKNNLENFQLSNKLCNLETINALINEVLSIKDPEKVTKKLDSIIQLWKDQFKSVGFDVETGTKTPLAQEEKIDELYKYFLIFQKELAKKTLIMNETDTSKLKQLVLKESLSRKPFLEIKLVNDYTLEMDSLNAFAPKIEAGDTIQLSDINLQGILDESYEVNYKKSIDQDDKPSTIENEAIAKISIHLKNYLNKNPDILTDLKIKNITEVSPQKAILIATNIAIRIIKFSRLQSQVQTNEGREEAKKNDTQSIINYLKGNIDQDGNGVCRNYASVTKAIFDAIKFIQNKSLPARLCH